MNWFDVISLSVIEGLTEFLPVSSTGHMVLWSALINGEMTGFLQTFIIVIQLGAILAVLSRYWKKLLYERQLLIKIAAAFIPTAFLAWLAYPLVKNVFLTDVRYTLIGLSIGAIGLLAAEKRLFRQLDTKTLADLTIRQAVLIGIFQVIAVFPGISRSASIMISGIFLGLSRKAAVEFSFLLGLPVLAAASGFEMASLKTSLSGQEWIYLLCGGVIAYVVARATINWLLTFVTSHSLAWFAYYRLIIVALFLLWFQVFS
jgi:undecaprenyl-diphosphatase